MLVLEGRRVSAITVQKILIDVGLGALRPLAKARLGEEIARQKIALPAEQVAFIARLDPYCRERHFERNASGELLSADTFFVGHLGGVGKVYMNRVVDTCGSYAFSFVYVSEQPEAAVAVLHEELPPSYRKRDLPATAICTDHGREFCASETHAYELDLDGIAYVCAKVAHPAQTASSRASTIRSSMRACACGCARPSMKPSRLCKPTWTFGSTTTTLGDPISATATADSFISRGA